MDAKKKEELAAHAFGVSYERPSVRPRSAPRPPDLCLSYILLNPLVNSAQKKLIKDDDRLGFA
jgi:hypothetical protein